MKGETDWAIMKVGSDAAALDLSDALDRQENYGSDPAIQTIAMDHIKIIHRVSFLRRSICDQVGV